MLLSYVPFYELIIIRINSSTFLFLDYAFVLEF